MTFRRNIVIALVASLLALQTLAGKVRSELNLRFLQSDSAVDNTTAPADNTTEPENTTQPVPENNTLPISENTTQPVPENNTLPISENTTLPISENTTLPTPPPSPEENFP
jgi:hypothetical protein